MWALRVALFVPFMSLGQTTTYASACGLGCVTGLALLPRLRVSCPILAWLLQEWVVVREVCQLFEMCGWVENDRAGRYVAALFPSFTHSLHLEHGFNDERDNEVRGARHKQRTETRLQAWRSPLPETKQIASTQSHLT